MGKVGEGVRKNGSLRRKRRCGRWERGKKEWKVKGEEKVGKVGEGGGRKNGRLRVEL